VQRHVALLEMAEILSRHHQPSDLFRGLAPSLRAVVPFDFLNFALHDPVRGVMQLHVWDGVDWPSSPAEFAVDQSVVGWVWEHGHSLNIEDLHRETRFGPGLSWLRALDLRSYVVLPLTTPHSRLGALGFGNKRPNAFSSRQVRYVRRVAEIVALCVDKTLIRASMADERARIELLLADADALSLGKFPLLSPDHTQPRRCIPPSSRVHKEAENPFSFVSPDALTEPVQLLAAYFGTSTVGLCILDREFRYLAVNSTLAEMNGVPPTDHLGKPVREVLGDFAETVESQFERVLVSGQPVMNYEVSALLPTRTEVGHWVEHFFPIKSADGVVSRIGVLVVEITKQKKLEESLRGLTANLRKEKERLEVLLEVSRILSADWDSEKIFPRISAVLRRVLRHECAAFSLYDEGNHVFVRQALDFPLGRGLVAAAPAITRGGPQERAVAERQAVTFSREEVAAFQSEPSMTGIAERFIAEGLKSLCCVPLLRPLATVGALSLASTRAEAFRPEDVALLNQVGAQLAIALENAQTARQIRELKDRLAQEKRYLEGAVHTRPNFEEIVGDSPALKEVLDQISTVATSDATVLILGETGTGKELLARAIHRISHRTDKRFFKVNCAAIPTGLLESELFGHEKGAFTGAISQKIGRMELADGGTLFLDEVGEIPLELQPKLLRVLQDKEFERLGSTRTIKVNLRLLAATNRDLGKSVAAHEFRSDLFYRLNVFPIRAPALHDRRTDIPMLVRHFVHKYARRMNRRIETIPAETMNALIKWHWPGNVRELENFIERSVILSEGEALRAPLAELSITGQTDPSNHTLENAEREHIIRVLRDTAGVISGPEGAAHRLGLKRTTLQSKIQRLKITREDFMKPDKSK
jgi:formate hydrogenlyase transcriptional activator